MNWLLMKNEGEGTVLMVNKNHLFLPVVYFQPNYKNHEDKMEFAYFETRISRVRIPAVEIKESLVCEIKNELTHSFEKIEKREFLNFQFVIPFDIENFYKLDLKNQFEIKKLLKLKASTE